LAFLFYLAFRSKGEIQGLEDYIIAGRKLSLTVATATLFGTWFGAGTLLAATDEIARTGLSAISIEPLGAGCCLILAGLLLAKPLWNEKLLTLADYYRVRFGPKAEFMFSLSTVTYFGWIAAQLVGMAGILNVFFEIPLWLGIVGTAMVATFYTTLGGMWSVAKTDVFQITLLLSGLVLLVGCVVSEYGTIAHTWAQLPSKSQVVVPTDSIRAFMGWTNLLLIGTLGNLPGSDLMQRVFASKSPQIARKACIFAGLSYLLVGGLPVLMGLYGSVYLPAGARTDIVAKFILEIANNPSLSFWIRPAMILTLLALISAVLSTLDSAMLTTASVITQNLIAPRVTLKQPVKVVRYCVVIVGVLSVGFAFIGESAYELLEGSYAMTMAGPLVPLLCGVYFRFGGEWAAVSSLGLGYLTICIEIIADKIHPGYFDAWIIPLPFLALVVSLVAYLVVAFLEPRLSTK